jgi:hypothetical protein
VAVEMNEDIDKGLKNIHDVSLYYEASAGETATRSQSHFFFLKKMSMIPAMTTLTSQK